MQYSSLSRVKLVLAAVLLAFGADAAAPDAQIHRLLLATYWGEDKVALIDTQAESQKAELWAVDVLKSSACSKPYDVRVDKRAGHAFVSCSGSDQIAVIDLPAQQVQYTITTGPSPRDLQLFDDDKKLIVANSGNDTVSVIDVAERKKIYDFPVSVQPYGVAVTDNGKVALVTGWASGDLHIFSLGATSATERARIPVGLLPYTVVAPSGTHRAYVAVNGADSVVAIDLLEGKSAGTIRVGGGPWSLALSPDERTILVTDNRSDSLSVLDTKELPAAGAAAPSFTAGLQEMPDGSGIERRPKNASISADGKLAAFTDLANDQIVVVDLPGGKIRRVINAGRAPYGIEFVK